MFIGYASGYGTLHGSHGIVFERSGLWLVKWVFGWFDRVIRITRELDSCGGGFYDNGDGMSVVFLDYERFHTFQRLGYIIKWMVVKIWICLLHILAFLAQIPNRGYILLEIIAFGPLSKRPANLLEKITYEEIPARTIPCEASPPTQDCLKYVIEQSNSSSVSPMRNSDSADLMIIMKVFKNFIQDIQDRVKNILIIA
ncbi:unnamed protein product [Brassica oleracea]